MHSLRKGDLDFWLAFAVPRAKLSLFRVCFFVLIGIDGLLQLPHAPRYGAGGFNVGHFEWLQAVLPEPGRATMVVLYLLQAYLGFRVAFGGVHRAALWLLTGVYGYAYFVSQLDSYQHHYLVFLLLLLTCFVPWPGVPAGWRVPGDDPDEESVRKRSSDAHDANTITSWAVRLVLVQVAIVYLWAAITKCEGAWLDGTLLDKQLRAGSTRDMALWLGMDRAAVLVATAEFSLAIALLIRRLWVPALVLGVGLHAGIEFGAEFKIGIFSYYMFAIYLLLVPDRLFSWLERRVQPRVQALRSQYRAALSGSRAPLLVVALCTGLALMCLRPIDLAEMTLVAVLVTCLTLGEAGWRLFGPGPAASEDRRPAAATVALGHLLAAAAVLLAPFASDSVGDYYKYWGGTARRLGQWDQAEIAYRHLADIRPDSAPAHYYLGRIAEDRGRSEQALSHYQRAQRANPNDYRGFLQAALIHDQAQRGPEAVRAARQAQRALQTRRPSRSTERARQTLQALLTRWASTPP